jgi:hypothetical protein
MKNLIQLIKERKFTEAENQIDNTIPLIMEKKIFEMKKAVAAKMSEQMGFKPAAEKLRAAITENEKEESSEKKEKEDDDKEQLDELSNEAKAKYVKAVNHTSGLFKTKKHSSLQGIKSAADTIQSQIKRSEDHPGKTSYSTNSLKKAHKSLLQKHDQRKAIANKVQAQLEESTEEELDEARINIVRARVRGGKIQRRKRVSNVPGMTLRGGTLKRMSAAERRRRKMGARRGKVKRKAKLSRSLMKRKRSLQKRKSLGL